MEQIGNYVFIGFLPLGLGTIRIVGMDISARGGATPTLAFRLLILHTNK